MIVEIDGATLDVEFDNASAGPGIKASSDPYVCGVVKGSYNQQEFQDAYGTDLDPFEYFDRYPEALRAIVDEECDEMRRCGWD